MPGLRLRPRQTASASPALRARSNRDLLTLAAAGDADAFAAIYDRHSTVAYSLAYRICCDAQGAEDVVQEAFLSLWRDRDRDDEGRGEVRSWLLGIVHNSAIDRLRRTGVHERRRASSEGIEERVEAPERVEDEVQTREQAEQVRHALQALPDEQRQVIELSYFDGFTHAQIATSLDQPVGTVKGRMCLGLRKLHAQLAETPARTGEAT
jgi:RNA polymerase sigma-70 factor (ECF subfamily)